METRRILGKYEITYERNGFTQIKQLISKDDYGTILKPLLKIITLIEDDNKGRENKESKLLKESLKLMFGNYKDCFVEGSAMHTSLKNGIISLPPQQGGDHKVSWKKLKTN